MAETGVVTLTEDDLSCDVCFEVYRDPQALRCLHTFCRECVDKLVDQYKEVECPHCREVTNVEDVRKDFKTQTLVDQHIKVTKTTCPASGGLTCGMCQKKKQVSQMYCTECGIMCSSCQMIHQGLKVCTDHDVIQIEVVQKSYQEQLEKTVRMLNIEKEGFKISIYQIEDNISEINQAQKEQIQDVNTEIDKQIKELNIRRLTLHKQIQEVDMSKLEKLDQAKVAYIKSHADVENNITMICDVIKEGDVETLKHKCSYIADSVTTELKKITEQLPSVTRLLSEAPSVSYIQDANANKSQEPPQGPEQVIENTLASSPNHIVNYATLIKNTYESSKTVLTKCNIYNIKLIDDALYCACGNKGIQVYNKDCELISTIVTRELGEVRSVAQYKNGDLIVACVNGIHQLKPNGEYKGLIANGNFSDICLYKDLLYALACIKRKLVVFEPQGNIWKQIRHHYLIHKEGCPEDRLCIAQTGIYISSEEELQIYDHQGNEQYKADDFIKYSRISDLDDEGNALVANWYNEEINVFQGKKRCNISLRGTHAGFSSLVTDQTGETIWAGSAPVIHSAKLIKYTKT